jgi:hypothetical protein
VPLQIAFATSLSTFAEFCIGVHHWGHPTLHFIISNKEQPFDKADASNCGVEGRHQQAFMWYIHHVLWYIIFEEHASVL